jgi:hypothetical protein
MSCIVNWFIFNVRKNPHLHLPHLPAQGQTTDFHFVSSYSRLQPPNGGRAKTENRSYDINKNHVIWFDDKDSKRF